MICVLDKDFSAKKIEDVDLPASLRPKIEEFIFLAEAHGLYCPTIRLYSTNVVLKYDQDKRYVNFIISNDETIKFIFGISGDTPHNGKIVKLEAQLQVFSNYIYDEKKKCLI